MSKIAIVFSLIFLLVSVSNAQSDFTVNAKSGLFIRSTPDFKGEKVGKLYLGQKAIVFDTVQSGVSYFDGNETVIGNWVSISNSKSSPQYVFDEYLSPEHYVIYDDMEFDDYDERTANESIFQLEQMDVTIHFYRSYLDTDSIRPDRHFAYEEVFYDLSNKLVRVEPKIEYDKIEVFFTEMPVLYEHYQRLQERIEETGNPHLKRIEWSTLLPWQELHSKNNCFRIPEWEMFRGEEGMRTELALRDTTVWYPSEYDDLASLVYKDVPVMYTVESGWIKVIVYPKEGKPLEEVIEINYSYGC